MHLTSVCVFHSPRSKYLFAAITACQKAIQLSSLVEGNDHRVGFGFRFGNHADFQILYEFGPQTITTPTQAIKSRSPSYRHTRKPRRRPLIDLLIRTGLLREVERIEKHPRNTTKKQSNSTQVKA
ncbi:hypothetical protein RR46_12421 [Papilio xuthus]|uniref:Uncharacterized protein n=1 Tax=Papilio xuthus TaxID=66420 RepID=A0A194PSH6_PAPXU|nr:hypothetical protein RR46_12421 [Papilio xuthus]